MSTVSPGTQPVPSSHDSALNSNERDAQAPYTQASEPADNQHKSDDNDNKSHDIIQDLILQHEKDGTDSLKLSATMSNILQANDETRNLTTSVQALEHEKETGSENIDNLTSEQPLEESEKAGEVLDFNVQGENSSSLFFDPLKSSPDQHAVHASTGLLSKVNTSTDGPEKQQEQEQQPVPSDTRKSPASSGSIKDNVDNIPNIQSSLEDLQSVQPSVPKPHEQKLVKDSITPEKSSDFDTETLERSLSQPSDLFSLAQLDNIDMNISEPQHSYSNKTSSNASEPHPVVSALSIKKVISLKESESSTENKADNDTVMSSISLENVKIGDFEGLDNSDVNIDASFNNSEALKNELFKDFRNIKEVSLPEFNKDGLDKTFIDSLALTTSTDKLDLDKPKEKGALDLIPFDIILPKSLQPDTSKFEVSEQSAFDSSRLDSNSNIFDIQALDNNQLSQPNISFDGSGSKDTNNSNNKTSIGVMDDITDTLPNQPTDSQSFLSENFSDTKQTDSAGISEQHSKEFLETLEDLNLKDFRDVDKFESEMKDFESLNLKDFKDLDKLDSSLLSAKLPESLDAIGVLDSSQVDTQQDSNGGLTLEEGIASVLQSGNSSLADTPDLSNINVKFPDLASTTNALILLNSRRNPPARAQSEALANSSISKPEAQSHAASVPHSPTLPTSLELLGGIPASSSVFNSTTTLDMPMDGMSLENDTNSTNQLGGEKSSKEKDSASVAGQDANTSFQQKDNGSCNNTLPAGVVQSLNQIPNSEFADNTHHIYDEASDRPTYQLSNSIAPMIAPGNTGTMTPGVLAQSPSLLPVDSISDAQISKSIGSFKQTSPYAVTPPRFSRIKSDKSSTLQAITALNSINDGDIENSFTGTEEANGLSTLQGMLPGTELNNGIEDDIPRVSAYARLDFPTFIFYVQTLQVILGRSGQNSARSIVDVDLGPIKAISRKHAKIFYNFGTQRFELSVLGRNGAFVDDEFVETGSTVPLRNGYD